MITLKEFDKLDEIHEGTPEWGGVRDAIVQREALLAACQAAIKELNADIPTHPMRDKCFHFMYRAKSILSAARRCPRG